MITLVDLEMGNIHSVRSAFEHLGQKVQVTKEAIAIERSDFIVLPGVGSFPAAMRKLRERKLDVAIRSALCRDRTRLLGICLGMQLLGLHSDEDGGAEGLGIMDFEVRDLKNFIVGELPLPHIGFNSVRRRDASSMLLSGITEGADFYFVHSFAVRDLNSPVTSAATYGVEFAATVESPQVFGTQFHPEKSQSTGLRLLQNFAESG